MPGDDPGIALDAEIKYQQRFVAGKQCLGFLDGHRLRPGEAHVVGEALFENLLQLFAFRLDLGDAHADLLLGRGRALRRRLGDKRNHGFVQCFRFGGQVLILTHELR